MQVRWGRLLTDDVRPDVILKSRWDFSANSTEVKLCWWKSRSRCPVLLMSFYIWNHCVVENIEIKIKYSFHPKKKRFHFQIHGSKVSAQFSLYLNLQWYFCVPLLTVRTITPHRGPDVQALPSSAGMSPTVFMFMQMITSACISACFQHTAQHLSMLMEYSEP